MYPNGTVPTGPGEVHEGRTPSHHLGDTITIQITIQKAAVAIAILSCVALAYVLISDNSSAEETEQYVYAEGGVRIRLLL